MVKVLPTGACCGPFHANRVPAAVIAPAGAAATPTGVATGAVAESDAVGWPEPGRATPESPTAAVAALVDTAPGVNGGVCAASGTAGGVGGARSWGQRRGGWCHRHRRCERGPGAPFESPALEAGFGARVEFGLLQRRARDVTNDSRRDRQYDLGFQPVVGLVSEQPPEDGDVAQPRDLVGCLSIVVVDEAGENLVFAVLEPQHAVRGAGAYLVGDRA